MSKHIIISPSILSGDFANMERTVNNVKIWGGDWIHCDVMDGVYVTNFTFGMPMVDAISRVTNLPLDVHLMIDKPEKYAERFVKAGANIVTFHPDASDCPLDVLKTIKSFGARGGIAFNPNVKIEDYEYLLPYCDIIVIMTVYAGYGGQKLIKDCLEKVRFLKEKLLSIGSGALIEVDGGVTEGNAKSVIDSGADILVAGSSIFNSTSPIQTIKILKGVTK